MGIKAFFLFILLFIFTDINAAESYACSHPELCRLAKIIFDENAVKNQKINVLVNIKGDPHEFEPSSLEIKELIKHPFLITGPNELNPWIKKIKYQRSKMPQLKTFTLDFSDEEKKYYPHSTNENLSHFWLYPNLYCRFKMTLSQKFYEEKILSKDTDLLKANEICIKQGNEIEEKLKQSLKEINLPIILTHDALWPLLSKLNANNVVAIKGSSHHEEVSPAAIKNLYNTLKAPSVLWIEENNISIPHNIINKKRSTDYLVKINTAESTNLNPFDILEKLHKQILKIKKGDRP